MDPLLDKKIENFSNLSDEEGGRILEKYLLQSLESETLLEREMMAKFLVYPYSGREPIRKVFNLAVKRNEQKVGNFTVGEWLKKYVMTYGNVERTPNTFFEFVRDNAETKTLSKRDQTRLMRIFRMYDYLLVGPILELDDVRMNILRFPMYINEDNSGMPVGQKNTPEQSYAEESPRKIINATIQEALKNYPQLGEQGITNNQLKLKYFPTLVRPSIKNWITDFHDNMGAGKHSSIDRANYLFHSDNGKKITPVERQKLTMILKSLEEQVPLSIDVQAQAIVFNLNEQQPESIDQQPKINEQRPTVSQSRLNENRYAADVTSAIPSLPRPTIDTQRIQRSYNGEQKDVFQRYASPAKERTYNAGFSPNFASKELPTFSAQVNRPAEKIEPKKDFFQMPKSKPVLGSDNYFDNFASAEEKKATSQNFAPAEGAVSFSSAQKLPVEQNADSIKAPEKTIEQLKPAIQSRPQPQQSQSQPQFQSQPQMDNISQPPKPVSQKSQWHIEPSRNPYEEEDDKKNGKPKILGNIIDLRN
jgi:hypothetical protein